MMLKTKLGEIPPVTVPVSQLLLVDYQTLQRDANIVMHHLLFVVSSTTACQTLFL